MTIEAMKLALEALKKCMYPQLKQLNAITALRTAIAEAEKQEPVAELWDVCEGEPVILWKKDWRDVSVGTKFYTHSAPTAQREWVGLTDEEVLDAFCKTPHTRQYVEMFSRGARWAEAKLKEKSTWALKQ